ncbi:MAG TPA: HlyD family efflux transporter periplasmic adaptor subunit, partial [Candidatus Caenarcaniphilales bacterium]
MWSSKITEDKTVQRYIGSWIAAVIFLGPGTACSTMQAQAPSAQEAPPAPATTVVTRGKIIPEWDIIKLSVSNAEDSRVNKMLVKEGDRVQANQVIAILQGADQRLADLKAAQANVKLLRAKLTKAQQGETKPGAIAAQRAAVARLKAQLPAEVKQKQAAIAGAEAALHEATLTYQRRQILSREGAIGQADLDAAQKELETAQATLVANKADLTQTDTTLKAQIAEGQAKLAELQQVLPSDIAIAQAELEKALIEVEQKKADLEDARVRAPVAGQILRINTKVGEQVNTQLGIVDLGRTERMFVRAEVYETDLTKIRK